MLFLLSPAKALDYETPLPAGLAHSQPAFVAQAGELVSLLRPQSPQQIAQLMRLSDPLASLNAARYQAWSARHTAANARPAVLAFNGDVYAGLDARSLAAADLDWLQQHLRILSGLYGVLRPLDRMQPYRLEMGTRLASSRGANLYQFWGARITEALDEPLAGEQDPVLVNLASQEYFKVVDRRQLKARVIDCVFEDYKGGAYKVIGFLAKRARGLMARYAALHRVNQPADLAGFDFEGYAFTSAQSTPERLVFRRRR